MKYITVKNIDRIAILQITRAETLNALDYELLQELDDCITDIERDNGIDILIITGIGKSFVAGADIKQMSEYNNHQAKRFSEFGSSIFRKIELLNKVTIAAINGYALGGGMELALSCDFRIANEKAKFGQPEVSLGIIPGFSATQRLPRLIGISKAKELIYLGQMINSQEALNIGLINRIAPNDDLIPYCAEFAKQIQKNSISAVLYAKKSIQYGIDVNLDKGIVIENNYFSECFETEDQKVRMKNFLQK